MLPTPTIVKIDVEAHELQVLQGMLLPSLAANNVATALFPLPTIIQFENKDGRVEPAITELLHSAGYKIGTARGHDQNTVAERLQPIIVPAAATTNTQA